MTGTVESFPLVDDDSTRPPGDLEAFSAWVADGGQVELLADAPDSYRDVLQQTIAIAADLEIMSLPLLYNALLNAPDVEARIAVAASIQDEMGHAQMMFRLLEEFGVSAGPTIFGRKPEAYKSLYILEHGCDDYIEFICMQAYGDRAGYMTTVDLAANCSFAPYRRSLAKVNFEEKFHFKHGEREIRRLWEQRPDLRDRIQATVDWMFPLAVEWFGVTDDMKSRSGQLTYRIRGYSNDELRQRWLREATTFSESVGLRVPAHHDEETDTYVLDYRLPVLFDEATKTWDLETTVEWPAKFAQWKKGGPRKLPGVELIQGQRWGAELWAT